jgi:ribosomal protein S18 acetylase RimI-like enzyme
MPVEIRTLGPGDEAAVLAAGRLFDAEPTPGATERFLAEPNHHLLIAYDEAGDPVGFVTGVETRHPDKGTEMFLYELSVAEAHRRQGIGTALVRALAELAHKRRCYGMWVLVDDDNAAALATYAAAGGTDASRPHMVDWALN